MGRSLRRIKKSRPKIIKRKAKTKFAKSQAPQEIAKSTQHIAEKFGVQLEWDSGAKIDQNYQRLGFMTDANHSSGRNQKIKDALAEKAAELPSEDTEVPVDDELKAAMAGMRSTGKAVPKRPTPRQRQLVQRLQEAHGDDIGAMVRDRKVNTMQHSAAYLTALVESCSYWSENSGVDFRVPHKRLW